MNILLPKVKKKMKIKGGGGLQWLQIEHGAGRTKYDGKVSMIEYYSDVVDTTLSVTYGRSVFFSGYSGFLHQ